MSRARNRSSDHTGVPGACISCGCGNEGRLSTRQRRRAPLRSQCPPTRNRKAGTPYCSAATASRRVAVKSSARGLPWISPITAESEGHFSPSAMAQSASSPFFAATWTILRPRAWGRPCRNILPNSRMAILSCTHNIGRSVASLGTICESISPTAAASPGAANISCKVDTADGNPVTGVESFGREARRNRHEISIIRESPVPLMFQFGMICNAMPLQQCWRRTFEIECFVIENEGDFGVRATILCFVNQANAKTLPIAAKPFYLSFQMHIAADLTQARNGSR